MIDRTATTKQVIAWEDKGTTFILPGNAVSVMRYGVVIIGGSAEAAEGGGDGEDGPGEGLRPVRVKMTPGRVDTLLSTQVRCE